MRRHHPWIIGGLIGALALAALPLSGVLPHAATEESALAGWYHALVRRQSVTLRTVATPNPAPDSPAMAARAAGDADLWNITLYWHFAAFTAVLTALVIGGFPLLS